MTKYVRARWSDGAFRPQGQWEQSRCERDFAGAGLVTLTVEHERDMVSHRKQFAVVRTAWKNLPETLRDEDFAVNEDCLRKYALIRCGYCDVETALAYSKAAALELGALMGNLARQAHGYCIVQTQKRAVRVWTPHSQSTRTTSAETFSEQKRDVTSFLADLLGVSIEALEQMGRQEAA
jgi:hypothetical protein